VVAKENNGVNSPYAAKRQSAQPAMTARGLIRFDSTSGRSTVKNLNAGSCSFSIFEGNFEDEDESKAKVFPPRIFRRQ
jgi:hypothetical protein